MLNPYDWIEDSFKSEKKEYKACTKVSPRDADRRRDKRAPLRQFSPRPGEAPEEHNIRQLPKKDFGSFISLRYTTNST